MKNDSVFDTFSPKRIYKPQEVKALNLSAFYTVFEIIPGDGQETIIEVDGSPEDLQRLKVQKEEEFLTLVTEQPKGKNRNWGNQGNFHYTDGSKSIHIENSAGFTVGINSTIENNFFSPNDVQTIHSNEPLLKVRITTPPDTLLFAELSGGSRLHSNVVHPFANINSSGNSHTTVQAKDLIFKSNGNALLNAHIQNGNVKIDTSGNSSINLGGVFNDVTINANGHGNILIDGPINGNPSFEVSGNVKVKQTKETPKNYSAPSQKQNTAAASSTAKPQQPISGQSNNRVPLMNTEFSSIVADTNTPNEQTPPATTTQATNKKSQSSMPNKDRVNGFLHFFFDDPQAKPPMTIVPEDDTFTTMAKAYVLEAHAKNQNKQKQKNAFHKIESKNSFTTLENKEIASLAEAARRAYYGDDANAPQTFGALTAHAIKTIQDEQKNSPDVTAEMRFDHKIWRKKGHTINQVMSATQGKDLSYIDHYYGKNFVAINKDITVNDKKKYDDPEALVKDLLDDWFDNPASTMVPKDFLDQVDLNVMTIPDPEALCQAAYLDAVNDGRKHSCFNPFFLKIMANEKYRANQDRSPLIRMITGEDKKKRKNFAKEYQDLFTEKAWQYANTPLQGSTLSLIEHAQLGEVDNVITTWKEMHPIKLENIKILRDMDIAQQKETENRYANEKRLRRENPQKLPFNIGEYNKARAAAVKAFNENNDGFGNPVNDFKFAYNGKEYDATPAYLMKEFLSNKNEITGAGPAIGYEPSRVVNLRKFQETGGLDFALAERDKMLAKRPTVSAVATP